MPQSSATSVHTAMLDRLLQAGSRGRSVHEIFAGTSDEFWLWAFTEGYRSDSRLRELLPSFPPEEVQYRFAGAAGDPTVIDAFGFYRLVKEILAVHHPHPVQSVLEFGCGWGRIIRLFIREAESTRLWGIDCMSAAIDICKTTNPHATFRRVEPFPPSGLASDSFDLVYAFSVFSHLSEDAHRQWLTEFKRILRPGGVLILTTRPRDFILMCAELRARQEKRAWAQGTVLAFKDTEGALERYDRGEYLYEGMGGGDVLDKSFFGETCIPRAYVAQHWTRDFEFVDYIDDRSRCLQNVAVVRKR